MMKISKFFRLPCNFGKDERGGALVEFAMLTPVFLALVFGVIQVGAYAQNYNAVRNLSSDASRFALVQYQKNVSLTNSQIEDQVKAIGIGGTYNLHTDRLGVTVSDASSRIAGVKELNMRITYAAPNWLSFVDVQGLSLAYERPLFLLDSGSGGGGAGGGEGGGTEEPSVGSTDFGGAAL